jgi:hypothetical protein
MPVAQTTLILGAGTNRILQDEHGMRPPLTRDLFLQALGNPTLGERLLLDQMKIVFDYIERFWHLSIDQLREREFDLEECYTFLHLQREEALASGNEHKVVELSQIIYQLFFYFARCLATFDKVYSGNGPFGYLAAQILERKAAVLSFNYDTLLEQAIESASGIKVPIQQRSFEGPLTENDLVDSHFKWNRPCAYGIAFDYVQLHRAGTLDIVDGSAFYERTGLYSPPLLKLHGSLNWFIYSGQMVVGGADAFRNTEHKGKSIVHSHYYDSPLPPQDNLEYLEPLIITPVLNKPGLGHPLISKVWDRARRELLNCKKLIIVGYSFPPTDFHVRRLFREVFSEHSIAELVVVNPDSAVSRVAKDLCNFRKPVLTGDNLGELQHCGI